MVFCNNNTRRNRFISNLCHNPYFNRWFSAITSECLWTDKQSSHNPYFNRWFSAIRKASLFDGKCGGHNPYFNRWFSAIVNTSHW